MSNVLRKRGYTDATYEDLEGRIFSVLLPPGVPASEARSGVLLGPQIDLSAFGLPQDLAIRLHNALQSRGILTYEDARHSPNVVNGAVLAAVKLDARRVIESYHVPAVD